MNKTAIIGTDSPIGLTMVRELGEHGVPVHAIGSRKDSLGASSRFAAAFTVRPSQPVAGWLPAFVRDNDIGAVMAVSEGTLVELSQLASAMPDCTIIAPEPAKLALVLDKQATMDVARKVGINIPAGWQPRSSLAADIASQPLTYPVAVKWADPVSMAGQIADAGLPLEKIEYASSPMQLQQVLARYDRLGAYPLVQEYAAGYGLGQMINMHQGRATLKFQHQRLREWPPSGGVSTYCASVPLGRHSAQMDLSEALLSEIGWEGPAMVEYRHDPSTGRYCLMEINGRFWGSIPLAYHSGAHFVWESWRCAHGLGAVEAAPIRHRRARYMVPDTKHLAAQIKSDDVAFAAKLKLLGSFILRYFDPSTAYYVWSLRDPRPFFADAAAIVRKALRRGSA